MGTGPYRGPLERVDECCWRIPKSYKHGMRVDGLIFTNERLLANAHRRRAPLALVDAAVCRARQRMRQIFPFRRFQPRLVRKSAANLSIHLHARRLALLSVRR